MAYLEKYYIDYCDDFNTSRRVSILQRDYLGSATELLADVNPISIRYDSSEDFKFSPIRPSVADVNMIFDSESGVDFEEFWTSDEKEFKIESIKDGVVEWSGFVISDGFTYDLKGGLYYASISASDGLGLLENLTFIDDDLKPYGNQDLTYNNGFEFPPSLILTEILRKLELDLDLWICVDSYESTMLKVGDVREADPLSSCYLNTKTYITLGENKDTPYWYGSGEEWNCKDVLQNILYMFGAKIYQESGVWRVKTINSDIDYGSGDTQRYWRKYNTAGVYLFDYEIINDERNIPCNSEDSFLVETNHTISMDEVYKAFRMNYQYTFVRDGDSPINTILNGDFELYNDVSKLSAPDFWARGKLYPNTPVLRMKSIDIPTSTTTSGYTKAVQIGEQRDSRNISNTQQYAHPETGLITVARPEIKANDTLDFEVWCAYQYIRRISVAYFDRFAPMFRLIIIEEVNGLPVKHFLLNTTNGYRWEKTFDGNYNLFQNTWAFYLDAQKAENYDPNDNEDYKWYHHKANIPNAPASGTAYLVAHGTAIRPANIRGRNFTSIFPVFENDIISTKWVSQIDYSGYGYDLPGLKDLAFTGVFLGIIPSGDDLAAGEDYIYDNTNTNYSLQVEPITVYNGDAKDVKHLSGIVVPTNTTEKKNFWDDLSNSYGSSSLGLLTVREIMRQYAKPYRVLEGTIKVQDARFGSVYTFDAIPDTRFILQRGYINKQRQYIEDATFVQITGDVLPDGGTEGGNTLDPNWQPTGNSFCQKSNIGNTNTGYIVTEEVDINPNSETYKETREVVSESEDFDTCPFGFTWSYFFGNDDVYLNTDTLNYSPYSDLGNKTISINYSNIDGNYLYFLHLKTLGVVEQITTSTSPNNVISDWVYVSDVIINGYIYRVLRTDYVMTDFTDFIHYFKFA